MNHSLDVQQAYNNWAEQYDTNNNKTRDLEALATRTTLAGLSFTHCLEIGCGTGKNTSWFVAKAAAVTAIDLSEAMLAKAREKVTSANVVFQQADITGPWTFVQKQYDLISFSLVLEHIEHLDSMFSKIKNAVTAKGYIYIGELHPFKQYTGSKARFDTAEGQQVVTCFNHHISDFTQAAKKYGFQLRDINEFFDDDDRTAPPRILTLLFQNN